MVRTIGKNHQKELPEKNSRSEHACRRATDHLHLVVNFVRDGGIAKHALQAMGYTGNDGALVWQAACWCRAGILTEAQFGSAYNGVRLCSNQNPIGHFRTLLAETLGPERLKELVRRTRIPDGILDAVQASVVPLVAIKRVKAPLSADESDKRHRQIMADLARLQAQEQAKAAEQSQ